MLLTYESLFLDRQIRNDGSITKEMVLLYPTPDVLSKHTVLALTENGDKAGQLLSENADLQRLAAKYGFRTTNSSTFRDVLTSSGVALPPDLMNIVDPPRYELLEYMIATLEKQCLEHTREITPTQSNRHAHGRDAATRDTRHGLQSAVRQAGLEARSVDRTISDHAATARRLEQPITLRVLAGSEVKDMAEVVEEASKATNRTDDVRVHGHPGRRGNRRRRQSGRQVRRYLVLLQPLPVAHPGREQAHRCVY
jgi:hypothetical protein